MTSKCSRVLARFKEIELGENKIKFRIKSMKNEDLIKLMDKHKDNKVDENKEDAKEGLEGMDEIVFMFLKREDPEITMKEVSDLDLCDKMLVANTGMEISGMGKNIFDFEKAKDESKKKAQEMTLPQPSKVQSLKQELIKEVIADSE